MKLFLVLWLTAALLLAAACGKKDETLLSADIPRYTAFRDVREATAPLRTASRAIVKIETEASSGTASFVSADGVLLTNNHVLGIEEKGCAREGCWVSLYFEYELGAPYKPAVDLFAEPLAVSPELDASLFQMWTDETRRAKYTPPHHLELDAVPTPELLRRGDVHMIGHPSGSIKKWVKGRFFRNQGAHVYSTLYGLPGNSGSPYLDERGRVIGIHHHHATGNGKFGRRDVHYYAYGTSAQELAAFVGGPRGADRFFSVDARHTEADVAFHHALYLGRGKGEAVLDSGAREPVPQALARQCDAALAVRFSSPEDLDKRVAPCQAAWDWLNCRKPDSGRGFKFCPVGAEKDAWKARFGRVAEKMLQFHSEDYLKWLASPWRLETTPEASVRVEGELIDAYLARTSPPLTFLLAYWLLDARGAAARYQGVSIADYVRNYTAVPHYEHDFSHIIDMHETLLDEKVLTPAQFASAVSAMFGDEKLTVVDKLSLEAIAYRLGVLR